MMTYEQVTVLVCSKNFFNDINKLNHQDQTSHGPSSDNLRILHSKTKLPHSLYAPRREKKSVVSISNYNALRFLRNLFILREILQFARWGNSFPYPRQLLHLLTSPSNLTLRLSFSILLHLLFLSSRLSFLLSCHSLSRYFPPLPSFSSLSFPDAHFSLWFSLTLSNPQFLPNPLLSSICILQSSRILNFGHVLNVWYKNRAFARDVGILWDQSRQLSTF